MIVFWMIQAEPCQPTLGFLNKLLKDNPQWKEKVRPMGIVMDKDNPIMVQPHIETFEFTEMEHVLQA